ncbi:MAG TPA: M20/M25/M40 family metallo-hydrolase [Caulobacteraceae bacterium]|jgi:acetylornithine deacetylase/succinyl-diaminopimelate desuccinylase-like protein
MRPVCGIVVSLTALIAATSGLAQTLSPDQAAFRATYKELVETNTSLSVGSCTEAAEKMAARLKAAGYPDADIHLFTAPDHPKEGGLVAVLHGTDPKSKGLLLLAHIDVVEAKREDWTRDPFKLVEENGYFYGRGASDDKAMAAVWVDTLIRYRQEGFHPRRDIKMALTCGEETTGAFNGADYLAKTKHALIDSAFALNEGAGGRLDEQGKRISLGIQAGEKVYQDFTLETTNPGGHSSRPVKDNAIYHLADGLARLRDYDFPVQFNDATRLYFDRMSKIIGGENGAAMQAILKDPNDAKVDAVISRDSGWHSMLRTTCVATMLEGGHAHNALPQRARANVNCRIFPGTPIESVRQTLIKVVNDPAVSVSILEPQSPTPPAPPLTAAMLGPVESVSAQLWPGVPVVPTMSTGATDGVFMSAGGIPTYGLSGMFGDPDGDGVHGLNERIRVRSLYEGRDFLYHVVKLYASAKAGA